MLGEHVNNEWQVGDWVGDNEWVGEYVGVQLRESIKKWD